MLLVELLFVVVVVVVVNRSSNNNNGSSEGAIEYKLVLSGVCCGVVDCLSSGVGAMGDLLGL